MRVGVFFVVALLSAGRAMAAPSCTPGHLVTQPIGGTGVASPPASDAPLNPGSKGNTYVLQGNRLLAFRNSDGTPAWPAPHVFTATFANTTMINPVKLSGSGMEVLFLIADGSVLYEISAADGSFLYSQDLAALARDMCPKATSGDLAVLAAPAVQLCAYSNANFSGGAACTDAMDLVIVPTHFLNCDGYNRVMALRASDLTLPGAGGVGAPGWTFGNSGSFVVDPAADSCVLFFSDANLSAPPLNNTVVCGTDQTNVLHNTLWALNTHPGGAFPHLGARIWSVNGGPILARPEVKQGTSRIYYGTSSPGSGALRVKNLADGSDIYSVPVASPIAMPVWSEFRGPFPGLTNMTMATTADGVFRRFVESGGTSMSEITPTIARGGGSPKFKTGAAVLPSAGRIYIGEDNGTVRQMDATTCESTGATEGYIQFGTATTTFLPALDVNDISTSTDIDRMSVDNAAGEMLRFCVPFGDAPSFAAQTRPASSKLPEPQACTTPQFAGDCTCDAQCASYAPASACYTPVCQIRGGATEGVCVLAKAPSGTPCDNGVACDCSPAFAAGGTCSASCGPSNPCDVCTDGVCIGTFRSACACNKIGDLACDASQGQGCCGSNVCVDLRSSQTNCGQCGRVCATGFKCVSGDCVRNYTSCQVADEKQLNNAAAAGKLPGGSAIEYTFDGSNQCFALVSLMNGANSFVMRVDSSSNVVPYDPLSAGGAHLPIGVNGVSSTPDGKFWFANLVDPSKQAFLVVAPDPLGTFNLQQVTVKTATAATVPFSTPLYDQGFANRPAVHLKAYNDGQPQVFESNFSVPGDIALVDPALPGGSGACINNFCNAGTPFEALEYSIRHNGDGVLLAARGTTLLVICDNLETNRGSACHASSFSIDLADTSIYSNTDGSGMTYIPGMDRIYSIAVDRAHRSIYVDVGTSTRSQTVVIEDATLSADGAVVRNLVDVQIEHGLNHGNLKPTYTDAGGRLAVSRNGILTRIAVSATPGGTPTFYSGQIQ